MQIFKNRQTGLVFLIPYAYYMYEAPGHMASLWSIYKALKVDECSKLLKLEYIVWLRHLPAY